MLDIELVEKTPQLLVLDVENGPKWGWGPSGYTFSSIFCICWKWAGEPESAIYCKFVDWRRNDFYLRQELAPIFGAIANADGFIGHNFSHDQGLLVGLAKDLSMPELPDFDKPLIDTMRSVPKSQGAMRSLEALCEQFKLGTKPHIDTHTWWTAWIRWQEEALMKVEERCSTDVILTERLWRKEQELGWL